MTDFFTSNLLKIRGKCPAIYEMLLPEAEPGKQYEVIRAADGNYTLKVIQGREFLLNSRFAPVREAERFAGEHYSAEAACFILYGFGLGYHVRELLKSMNLNQRLHIIDLNPCIFKIALGLQDFSDIIEDKRVDFYISGEMSVISHILSSLLTTQGAEFIVHQPSLQCIDRRYEEFKLSLECWRVRLNSYERPEGMLQENLNLNKICLKENVGRFFGKYQSMPIVIISAGPSLDNNIALLKGLRGKALLFAVGRALRPLAGKGITPDFFIITDPQELVREQIRGLEDMDVPGFFMITAGPSAVKDYNGPKYAVYAQAEQLPPGEEGFLVEAGGSVATSALDIAIKMGGNPIVFVGQDLAFTGGKHHAGGTLYYGENSLHSSGLKEELITAGWDGTKVVTSLSLMIFKRWIESRIEREKDRAFINATEGGAFIKGCRHMRLQEFIDSMG